jgi:HD-GYP domain-containing protein (c-di-GMP phosphodiesterase class II)
LVRIALDTCIPNLNSPVDIFQDPKQKRLLLRRGAPITDKAKELLLKNNIDFLDFHLPFEEKKPPPYTFSEKTEIALFRFLKKTFQAFKEDSIAEPFDIRKEAYDIIAQAHDEFQKLYNLEHPMGDSEPKRHLRSIFHYRTLGSIEDYLYEHAKNTALLCVVMGFDYFNESKQLLADIHKTSVAAMFADIGMLKLPARLVKAEQIEPEDWEKIHTHVEISANFVEKLFRQKNFVTAQVVSQHHERLDLSGYPNRVPPSEMAPYTHLLAVADSYLSMISKRYFRPAKNPLQSLLDLNHAAGKQYEKRAIRCLNYHIAPYPVGSVANFAGKRMVQVLDLIQVPISFDVVPVYGKNVKEQIFNRPNHIKAFTADAQKAPGKAISIEGHLAKLGIPLDCFDLVEMYGYVNSSNT